MDNPAVFIARWLKQTSSPMVLTLALIARCWLTLDKSQNLDLEWNLKPWAIHIELVDLIIVALGFLLVGVHGEATASALFCRQIKLNRRAFQEIWQAALSEKGVALGTLFLMANAVAIFFFVRIMWVSHLCVMIQFLHLFPFIAVICQTLTNGLLLLAKPKGLKAHARCIAVHQVSNRIHILYTVLNCIVFFDLEEKYGASFVVVATEFFLRSYFLRKLQDGHLDNAISISAHCDVGDRSVDDNIIQQERIQPAPNGLPVAAPIEESDIDEAFKSEPPFADPEQETSFSRERSSLVAKEYVKVKSNKGSSFTCESHSEVTEDSVGPILFTTTFAFVVCMLIICTGVCS